MTCYYLFLFSLSSLSLVLSLSHFHFALSCAALQKTFRYYIEVIMFVFIDRITYNSVSSTSRRISYDKRDLPSSNHSLLHPETINIFSSYLSHLFHMYFVIVWHIVAVSYVLYFALRIFCKSIPWFVFASFPKNTRKLIRVIHWITIVIMIQFDMLF